MFTEILQRIVEETAGAVGAVLMGYDGIAIEQYFSQGKTLDLQMVAVEYANVLKEIRKTAEILDMGECPNGIFCESVAARFGIECICITRGENGCAIWQKDQFVESAGIPVEVADAVGAGDAFCAALMYGLSSDMSLDVVASFANRLGALVASRRGAVPDWTRNDIAGL